MPIKVFGRPIGQKLAFRNSLFMVLLVRFVPYGTLLEHTPTLMRLVGTPTMVLCLCILKRDCTAWYFTKGCCYPDEACGYVCSWPFHDDDSKGKCPEIAITSVWMVLELQKIVGNCFLVTAFCRFLLCNPKLWQKKMLMMPAVTHIMSLGKWPMLPGSS